MRVQLSQFGKYSALNSIEEDGIDEEDHSPPPPEPEPEGPPAPLDIWQTVFYGLSFTSAVGNASATILNEGLGDASLAVLALFSVYLPCFCQYLMQVCILAMPKSHEPLREVVPYLWELLNVALMCMIAANAPHAVRAFLSPAPASRLAESVASSATSFASMASSAFASFTAGTSFSPSSATSYIPSSSLATSFSPSSATSYYPSSSATSFSPSSATSYFPSSTAPSSSSSSSDPTSSSSSSSSSDDPSLIQLVAAFSFLIALLRFLSFLFYFLYRWTHNLAKHQRFHPGESPTANTAYLVTRGFVILLSAILWAVLGLLQLYDRLSRAAFIGSWWGVMLLDLLLVHLGLVTSLVARFFGKSRLFLLPNILGAFNLFFGSVLALFVIAATLFQPAQPAHSAPLYLNSLLVVCVAFFLAPTYNANFLKGWFEHHNHAPGMKMAVGLLWGAAHVLLFAAVITSGQFFIVSMFRDLDAVERWYFCVCCAAMVISLTVISHADAISFQHRALYLFSIARSHPTRISFMHQPLHQFLTSEELASIRVRRQSAPFWLSFGVSLFLRTVWATLMVFLAFIPVDQLPVTGLIAIITALCLLYALSSALHLRWLFAFCTPGYASKLLLKWQYAVQKGKIHIIHRSEARMIGLPEPASATDSESE